MSQRKSGYARIDGEKYYTPAWCLDCLIPHIPSRILDIFDPAAGTGNIVKALDGPFNAFGKDIDDGYDFLKDDTKYEAIICNPPFRTAEDFINHALDVADYVAMLLRCDYDHAKTRKYLFSLNPHFAKKIALTKRIVWFERRGAAPSFNHAWFIFDKAHRGPPTIAYAP